jgi:hypothetical protein
MRRSPRPMSFSALQNSSSRLTLVLWPAKTIECLTTSDPMEEVVWIAAPVNGMEALLPNRKRRSNIQINKLGLFINGNHISAPPRSVALLACLYANLGRVVPYRQLVRVLGYNPAKPARQKHLLRQYMLTIKSALSAQKVPYETARNSQKNVTGSLKPLRGKARVTLNRVGMSR